MRKVKDVASVGVIVLYINALGAIKTHRYKPHCPSKRRQLIDVTSLIIQCMPYLSAQ